MKKGHRDKLEDFIHINREAFDSEEPKRKVWVRFSEKVTASGQKKIDFSWLWKAAAIIFFGLSGYLFLRENDVNSNFASTGSAEMVEFQNAENYYNSLIHSKQLELGEYIDKDSPFYDDFKKDIVELDSIYSELKTEFDYNNDEMIMEAMVRNLQLRIEIMDRQLKIIQKVKKLNKNKNGVAI